MFGLLIAPTAVVLIIFGTGLFVSADSPFDKQGILGMTCYMCGWIGGLLLFA